MKHLYQSPYVFGLSILSISMVQSGCNSKANTHHPNVVIILADDMGWGDLKINGNSRVETPAIDRLASESLSFDRFYVCPLCAPTRAEMLTGRYFLRTGVSSVTSGYENMRTDEVTLAEVFKNSGYATGCFGKWHNGGYYPQHPNRQGFDEFVGFCVGHLGYYFDSWFLHNDDEVKSTGYTSDYFTDHALDFIDRNRDNPFLCYVPYNVPHSPFQVPEKYFNKYYSMGSDSLLSSVYGMVDNMDDNIDRILIRLDELKIRENTIVIFFSDNGPNTRRYNGNMKGIKGSVDEGGLRVPFYISWPEMISPGKTSQLAQDIDILPTLQRLCNIQFRSDKPLDGIDLSSIITGDSAPFDRYIFSRQAFQSLQICNGSVRNNRFRLVRSVSDTLLYDLENDPAQENDIALDNSAVSLLLVNELTKWENGLLTEYRPVTTIEAGFTAEQKFTLPVQDASLSGNINFSSIHPNQSHTENWTHIGDSVFWNLSIKNSGNYRVEIQYGCQASEIGSKMLVYGGSEFINFSIDTPFDSEVLPERDYVKRSESYERTWSWMTVGKISLIAGPTQVILKLVDLKKDEAGLFKAIRFTRL